MGAARRATPARSATAAFAVRLRSAPASSRLARRTEKHMRPSRPALATSVISVALLWTTLAVAQDQPVRDAPATVNGRQVPAVQGAWRSRGYGYAVRITDEGPKLFHV